jgi:hypothetical protein
VRLAPPLIDIVVDSKSRAPQLPTVADPYRFLATATSQEHTMNVGPRIALAIVVAAAFGTADAADHLLTFEEPGLFAMGNSPGAAVPDASRLHEQFLSTFGVSFSSGAGYVAVVNHGCCTPSVPNIIGGTTAGGTLSYGTPINITFFDPANIAAPGVTNFVQMRGDFTSIPGSATMSAYDVSGALLGSVTDIDNPAGVDLTLSFAGIHSVVLMQTSATIGLDNLAFNNVAAVAAAVPEPATAALMLGGLGALGWIARRRAARRHQPIS